MKKLVLTAAILCAATSGSAFAASGNTSTATGTATATVVSPIVLTHTAAAVLGFGKFTVGTTGGTVVVTSVGVGTPSGDVNFVPGSSNSADAFTVAGDASRSFAITSTGGNITNGTSTMAFTTTPSAATLTMLAAGTSSFTVGGTLTVASTSTAGAYTGTYTATVTYN